MLYTEFVRVSVQKNKIGFPQISRRKIAAIIQLCLQQRAEYFIRMPMPAR